MLTKVLEQKWVIRLFGVALMLSPFLNIFVSGEAALDPGQHMTWSLFWEFVCGVPIAFKVLEIASLAIGILMLRGSVTAWRYLLALLGGYIVLQFIHLGHNIRTDKTAWLFIGVNVVVFFFIADQLVLKPRSVTADEPVAQPVAPTLAVVPPLVANDSFNALRMSRKNIVIDLNGYGKFAKLLDISPDGLSVRYLAGVPDGLSTRLLAITLGGVDLQLRHSRQSDQEVFFAWENLSQHQVRSLNSWIRSISA